MRNLFTALTIGLGRSTGDPCGDPLAERLAAEREAKRDALIQKRIAFWTALRALPDAERIAVCASELHRLAEIDAAAVRRVAVALERATEDVACEEAGRRAEAMARITA